jgi:hypothetical protein
VVVMVMVMVVVVVVMMMMMIVVITPFYALIFLVFSYHQGFRLKPSFCKLI